MVCAKLKKFTFLPHSLAMPPAISLELEQKLLEALEINRIEKEGRLRLLVLEHRPPPSTFPRLEGHFGAGGQWFVQHTCNCDYMLFGNLRYNSNYY